MGFHLSIVLFHSFIHLRSQEEQCPDGLSGLTPCLFLRETNNPLTFLPSKYKPTKPISHCSRRTLGIEWRQSLIYLVGLPTDGPFAQQQRQPSGSSSDSSIPFECKESVSICSLGVNLFPVQNSRLHSTLRTLSPNIP